MLSSILKQSTEMRFWNEVVSVKHRQAEKRRNGNQGLLDILVEKERHLKKNQLQFINIARCSQYLKYHSQKEETCSDGFSLDKGTAIMQKLTSCSENSPS